MVIAQGAVGLEQLVEKDLLFERQILIVGISIEGLVTPSVTQQKFVEMVASPAKEGLQESRHLGQGKGGRQAHLAPQLGADPGVQEQAIVFPEAGSFGLSRVPGF